MYKYDLRYHAWMQNYAPGSRPHLEFVADGYELFHSKNMEKYYANDVLDLSGIQSDEEKNLYVDTTHYDPYFANTIAIRIAEHLVESKKVPCRVK